MDKPDIGAKTKQRVRQAAATLGYTPNIVARGLALRRSFTLGLIATELDNPVRGALVAALRRLARGQGYQVLVSGYDADSEVEGCIREMCARGVDGLLLGNVDGILSEKPYWPALDTAMRAGTPVVVFYHAITSKADRVLVDFSLFTEELTRHLLEVHRLQDILFAGTDLAYARGDGYRRAMQAAGLAARVGLIRLPGWSMADARQGIADYVAAHRAPQAILCHNDLAAMGVMAGLRDRGLRVPEDVAVVGVDNIDLAEYLNPALTTAGVAPHLVADELFALLQARISGTRTGDGVQVALRLALHVRESCGCGNRTPRPPLRPSRPPRRPTP